MTDCSKVIRVSNVEPGATVEIRDKSDNIVASIAGAPDVVVDVPISSFPLAPGTRLKVRQSLPNQPGYDSPLDGVVAKTPFPPLPPHAKSPMHRCGRCVILEGMSVGHTATVSVNNAIVGSALAFGPTVQVGLAIGAQGAVAFSATHCSGPPPSSAPLPYAPVSTPALPAPIINGPLYDCDTEISISGIVPGSILTLFRTNQPAISVCAPSDGRLVVPPLQAGQVIWAAARMEACGDLRTRSSPFSAEVTVLDDRPPTPVAIPPCPGTSRLYVSNLKRNARVLVVYGSETYTTRIGGSSTLIFHLPEGKTFLEGAEVVVTQSLCAAKFSEPPASVRVRHGAQTFLPLAFPFPLVAGAAIVRVENAGVWGRLELWSKKYGRLNVIEPTTSSVVDVLVSPAIDRNDTIEARFTLCDQTASVTRDTTVREPTPPKILSATACGQRVIVGQVLPGATVYLSVNSLPVTPITTASDTAEFQVSALNPGDLVEAMYVIGGQASIKVSTTVVANPGGAWTILPKTFEIPGDPDRSFLPVHAALLADPIDALSYRVLLFAGSQLDERFHLEGREESKTQKWPPHWNATRIWSPANGGTIGFVGNGLTYDAFCAGQCLLGDGSVLVVGGSRYYPVAIPDPDNIHKHAIHYAGVRDCARFDPVTLLWDRAPSLNLDFGELPGTGGRWYPTVVTLADGTALTMGGHPDEASTAGHTNPMVEQLIGPPASGFWLRTEDSVFLPDVAQNDRTPQYYPELFVLPSLSVQKPRMLTISYGHLKQGAVWLSERPSGRVAEQTASSIWGDDTYRMNPARGTAVLLPLQAASGYPSRVLAIGATLVNNPDLEAKDQVDLSSHTLLFDLGTPENPLTSMTKVPSPDRPDRWYGMATLLADGTVLYQGGVGNRLDNKSAVMTAEILDPDTRTWTTVSSSTIVRNYHSVSLLLPDGRVLVAGSNRNSGPSYNKPTATAPDPPRAEVDTDWTQDETREFRAEIYAPPYSCVVPRPRIDWSGPPPSVAYGTSFLVPTADVKLVKAVSMLRQGTSTHAFDPDQRCILPTFKKLAGALAVTLPPDGTVAPPGYYTLFLLGTNGSVSQPGLVVRLG